MSMKRWMMIAALAASSVGCVANQGDAPVRLLDARRLTGTDGVCALGTTQLAAGQLDISGGSSYLLGLRVETNTSSQELRLGSRLLSGGGLSDFIIQEIIVSYESQPSLPLPTEERIPVYAVFRPNTAAESGSFMVLYALGPKALEVLADSVSDEPVTVLATIKAAGRFSGGQTAQTNEVIYPITIINSGFDPMTRTCLDPALRPVTTGGSCGQVGQDNGPICRVPPPAAP
ncbi:MAG TPA: hypothetical protein VEY88_12065 [Archangium sp.]|nr:hypothetical protein [Archangium sp.]